MNRWLDWWHQAGRDLRHARNAADVGDYEWAAFASQQAAEKALKALILAGGGEPWGHLVAALAESVPSPAPGDDVHEAARRLDKHYIPTRYPNGFAASYPGNLYTKGEAEQAIVDATRIAEFCRGRLPEQDAAT